MADNFECVDGKQQQHLIATAGAEDTRLVRFTRPSVFNSTATKGHPIVTLDVTTYCRVPFNSPCPYCNRSLPRSAFLPYNPVSHIAFYTDRVPGTACPKYWEGSLCLVADIARIFLRLLQQPLARLQQQHAVAPTLGILCGCCCNNLRGCCSTTL